MPWKFYLEPLVKLGMPGHRLYVGRENHDQSFDLIIKPLVKHHEPHSLINYEDALLDDSRPGGFDVRGFLQAASDAAWELGIKPKQIEDHASELKATKYHLEDMRTLAKVKK